MPDSPFSRKGKVFMYGGPGSSEGEPVPEPQPTIVYAFDDRPVLIIWISNRGEKHKEQLVHYVTP